MSKSNKKLGTREKSLQAPFARAAKRRALGRALPRHSRLSTVFRVLWKDVANERNASLLASCTASAAHLSRRQRTMCGYIRKFIPAQNFKQSSHNGLKTVGPPLDFSTVPFRLRRRITFVRDIYCELFIALIGCCFCLLHFSCPLFQGGRDSFAVGRGMIIFLQVSFLFGSQNNSE